MNRAKAAFAALLVTTSAVPAMAQDVQPVTPIPAPQNFDLPPAGVRPPLFTLRDVRGRSLREEADMRFRLQPVSDVHCTRSPGAAAVRLQYSASWGGESGGSSGAIQLCAGRHSFGR